MECEVIFKVIGLSFEELVLWSDLFEVQCCFYWFGIFKSVEVCLGMCLIIMVVEQIDCCDVFVELEELRCWWFGYGLGYDFDNGVCGLFSLMWMNLLQ